MIIPNLNQFISKDVGRCRELFLQLRACLPLKAPLSFIGTCFYCRTTTFECACLFANLACIGLLCTNRAVWRLLIAGRRKCLNELKLAWARSWRQADCEDPLDSLSIHSTCSNSRPCRRGIPWESCDLCGSGSATPGFLADSSSREVGNLRVCSWHRTYSFHSWQFPHS